MGGGLLSEECILIRLLPATLLFLLPRSGWGSNVSRVAGSSARFGRFGARKRDERARKSPNRADLIENSAIFLRLGEVVMLD